MRRRGNQLRGYTAARNAAPSNPGAVGVRALSAAAGMRRAPLAAACAGTLASIAAVGACAQPPAPMGHQRSSAATEPSLREQLSRLGTARFKLRLQDAADESAFSDVPMAVTVSDVVADSGQCQLAYRLSVERDASRSDQRHGFALGDIERVTVEPFESFENEREGVAGLLYSMSDPEISTIVIWHRNGGIDWFAVMGAEEAAQLADHIRRRAEYCHRHRTP